MMRQARWFVIGAWLLVSGAACPQAPAAMTARREANSLRVNSAATVLMWALGLTDASDLDSYVASGFNTAYVLVSDPSDAGLTAASDLISAAEGKGLFAVAAVTPQAVRDADGSQLAPDPTSEAYAAAVKDLVTALVQHLGDHRPDRVEHRGRAA